MKIKYISILILLFLLPSCSRESTELELSDDACISPLLWGMTEQEAREVLKGFTLSETNTEALSPYFDFNATFLDQNVDIALRFTRLSPTNNSYITEKTEPLLSEIHVLAEDKDIINEKISEVLGPQKTQRLIYFNNAGQEGSYYGDELEEEGFYWSSEKTLLDILDDKVLIQMIPSDKRNNNSLLSEYYISNLYRVDWYFQENGKVLLIFNGSGTIIVNMIKSIM